MEYKIAKLPKWAQEHINSLSRQREIAIKELHESLDTQTKSPFYIDDHVCLEKGGPTSIRKYIQTHKITVHHQGVELTVILRNKEIDIQWGAGNGSLQEVAFIPESYQKARLVSKKNMRG